MGIEGVRPGQGGQTLERLTRGGASRTSVFYCGGISVATLFGLSTTQALVLLFVVLPFVVAAVVVPLVGWRSSARSGAEKPILTRDILASGDPGQGQILEVRPLGSIVDVKPMVRFRLRVRDDAGGEPFDLEVIQALPRYAMRQFRPGDVVDVRLTPDRSRGAVVWEGRPPGT